METFLDDKMPLNLGKIVMLFLDKSAQYARVFVSGGCPSSWSETKIKERWIPKRKTQQHQFVRDWRGNCGRKQDFWTQCNVKEEHLSSVVAQILHYTTLK